MSEDVPAIPFAALVKWLRRSRPLSPYLVLQLLLNRRSAVQKEPEDQVVDHDDGCFVKGEDGNAVAGDNGPAVCQLLVFF